MMKAGWTLLSAILSSMATVFAGRHLRASSQSAGLDWLPPVLGPSDMTIGLTADRDATWYLDRLQRAD